MPILHRLACFRDDVVFLVFLYQVCLGYDDRLFSDVELKLVLQRWIYRVDPKRVNEYGQVMASDADAVVAKEGQEVTETKKNK